MIIWNVATRKPVAELPRDFFQTYKINSVAFDPAQGSDLLLAGSQVAKAQLFRVMPAEPLYQKVAEAPEGGGRLIALWADGMGGMVGVQSFPPLQPPVYGPYLKPSNLLQLAPNSQAWQLVKSQPALGEATSAAFSLDGKLLASARWGVPEASIFEWQAPQGPTEILNYNEAFPNIDYLQSLLSLAFSSNTEVLAAGFCNYDKNVEEGICQTENNFILAAAREGGFTDEIQAHSAYIKALVYDPLNRYLASGSDDQTIQIWKLDDYRFVDPPTALPGPGGVASLAWNQNGATLAAGFHNQTMQLFGIEAGAIKPVGRPLSGPPGEASSLAFDSQGVLYSSNVGSGVYAWIGADHLYKHEAAINRGGMGVIHAVRRRGFCPGLLSPVAEYV
jgi:WD40 repeat protein